MKKGLAFIFIMLLFCTSRQAFAEPSPWTKEEKYIDKVTGKMDYGMRNFYLGWSEIFNEPIEHHNGVGDTLKSLGKGVVNFPIYTVDGLIHFVTCPITSLDVPIPNGGLQRFGDEGPGGYLNL
jgi:hypothetical protein